MTSASVSSSTFAVGATSVAVSTGTAAAGGSGCPAIAGDSAAPANPSDNGALAGIRTPTPIGRMAERFDGSGMGITVAIGASGGVADIATGDVEGGFAAATASLGSAAATSAAGAAAI
jgi:hypothetical protein